MGLLTARGLIRRVITARYDMSNHHGYGKRQNPYGVASCTDPYRVFLVVIRFDQIGHGELYVWYRILGFENSFASQPSVNLIDSNGSVDFAAYENVAAH